MRSISTQAELDGISGPVLCTFGAAWCGPCRALAPQLEELERAFGHVCAFVSVDVEQAEALCARHGVRQIPYVKITQAGSERMSCVNPGRDEIWDVLSDVAGEGAASEI